MLKQLLVASVALAVSAGTASAQCTSIPNVFTAGGSVSAAAVNANFNYLASCFSTVGVVRSHLAGLTLSTAGSSTSLSVAVGQAADSTNANMMSLASALTKTTSGWAVGNSQGGLDSGTIAANTWYHVHLIKRTDGTVVDVLFSTSATAPTLPTNYSLSRRIGSAKTNGSSQWTPFVQYGDEFYWTTMVNGDVQVSNPGTSAVTRTLTLPIGISVMALIQVTTINVGAGGNVMAYFSDLATTDTASSSVAPQVSDLPFTATASANVQAAAARLYVRTNASAQVRTRLSFSDANCSLVINTLGWIDRRGRDN
jgi:hypothetical protein